MRKTVSLILATLAAAVPTTCLATAPSAATAPTIPTPIAPVMSPARTSAPALAATASAVTRTAAVAPVTPYRNAYLGKQRLDPRCLRGRVICVSRSQRLVSLVVDGKPVVTTPARLGSTRYPTYNGQFRVYYRAAQYRSRRYGSDMPFSLFFDRGRAVHYSADFAHRVRVGLPLSSSHGCVNTREWSAMKYMFDRTPVGTKVVVG